MASTIVELTVTPPFERPHVHGVIALLHIANGPTSQKAEIRVRRYQAMDWMELEPGSELKNEMPHPVSANRAQAVLDEILEARLSLNSTSTLGIHETSFRLRVFSGAGFCEFNWWHEAPPEWKVLENIVREIRLMAEEVLNAA
jgi:hypothetical protein